MTSSTVRLSFSFAVYYAYRRYLDALNDFDKTKEESAKAAKAAEPAPSSGVPKLINFDDEYDVERLMEDGIPGMENFMSSFEDALSGDVMKQMEETMRSFSQNPELAAMLEQMTREMGGTGLEDLFAGQASAGKSAGAAAKKPEVQEKKTGAAGKSAAPAGSFQDAIAGSVQQLEQSKEQVRFLTIVFCRVSVTLWLIIFLLFCLCDALVCCCCAC